MTDLEESEKRQALCLRHEWAPMANGANMREMLGFTCRLCFKFMDIRKLDDQGIENCLKHSRASDYDN